jgi:hypothetical protein
VQEILGGAELVDDTIIKFLGCEFVKSTDFNPKKGEFYVLSNTSLMHPSKLDYIANNCKYIIVEHDYKIHVTRHPWRFKDNIIPKDERICYNLYRNAEAVFVQTQDHLDVMKKNEVIANFINLECSIWSDGELEKLRFNSKKISSSKDFAIIQSNNWIKNTQGAIKFCQDNKLNYELISSSNYDEFIKKLSDYSTLVFFPIARESCCRLIVEAKCLGLNVITNNNSGAFLSDWFSKRNEDLISYLSNQSKANLQKIKSYTYDKYSYDISKKKISRPVVKIWTGR